MPIVVSDQERIRRVQEEGSRRKRDLAAVDRLEACEREEREAAYRERVASGEDTAAAAALESAMDRMRTAAPASTFAIWLEPLALAAGDGTTLFLTAPDGIRTWVERRYLPLIREALQDTGYSEVEFVSAGEGM